MNFHRIARGVSLASALWWAAFAPNTLLAAPFTEFVDPHPAIGNQFGATVVPLNTGNVVITSPFDDAGGTDAGAVYLFSGATGALISTLRGSADGDNVGSGVVALSNGNYVVMSPHWTNGAIPWAGAATWGSGTAGVSGVVSAANSLVGSAAYDEVAANGVTELSNGNYVVRSGEWNNNAGAATWGNGTTGVSGEVSAANSLVGSTPNDYVGSGGISQVTALSNGNYVVSVPYWDNGAIADVGAATWGNGTTGVSGAISAANSLVGSTASDYVGSGQSFAQIFALPNGSYVVSSPYWANDGASLAGAVTWCNGNTGATGIVSAANSLVGSTAGDFIGGIVTVLSNGNYVVSSQSWDNGVIVDVGASTWCSGATGASGVVTSANSLVGSTTGDGVGGFVTALSNGNYVVSSIDWDNGAIAEAGAATWANGTTGLVGPVSAANSLVGSSASGMVGSVTALSTGNYVVASPSWANGRGAATWGNGATGVSGTISAANSLVGSTSGDLVSASGGVTPLSNGNYVIRSYNWHNGANSNAGAATWGSGTTGVSGVVSAANSLVGSSAGDYIGIGVTALSNGNYVASSSYWRNGATGLGAGAATWGSGTVGVSGVVSAANSLVGSKVGDNVSSDGVTALSNGSYVVASSYWDNGAIPDVGAVTWGSGAVGVRGVVSSANSLVGTASSDNVGRGKVTALSNGNYVVRSPNWDNGVIADAGAVTWGDGTTGVTGPVQSAYSLLGESANTSLQPVVVDDVNGTFFGRFLAEGGGRVRVGSSVIVVAVEGDARSPKSLEVFPNPVNSRTRIRFSLPESGPVKLAVYDVQGRRVVSILSNALRPAGSQQIEVPAGKWPLGLYLLQLEAGNQRETRKILVAR